MRKRSLAVVLVVLLAAALWVPALAADTVNITVEVPEGGALNESLNAYFAFKIFDATVTGETTRVARADDAPAGTQISKFEGVSYTMKEGGPFYQTVKDFKVGETAVFDLSEATGGVHTVKLAEGVESYDAAALAAELKKVADTGQSDQGGNWDFMSKTGTFQNLPVGYYMILDYLGDAAIVDTVGRENVTIRSKNALPTLEFGIVESDSGALGTMFTGYQIVENAYQDASATAGEEVVWRLAVTIPLSVRGDIMLGLSKENVEIDSAVFLGEGGQAASKARGADAAGVYIDISSPDIVTIILNKEGALDPLIAAAKEKGQECATAVFEIKGHLAPGPAVNTAEHHLKAQLYYPLPPVYTSPTIDTRLYTYALDVVKINRDQEVLSGAEFQLLRNDKAVKLTWDEAAGVYYVDPEGAETFEAGHATIRGLGGVAFALRETKAPAGYNPIAEAKPLDALTADSLATVTPGVEGAADSYVTGGVAVENLTGSELPSTGGMGITSFYVMGGLLAVGAVMLLEVNKKRTRG